MALIFHLGRPLDRYCSDVLALVLAGLFLTACGGGSEPELVDAALTADQQGERSIAASGLSDATEPTALRVEVSSTTLGDGSAATGVSTTVAGDQSNNPTSTATSGDNPPESTTSTASNSSSTDNSATDHIAVIGPVAGGTGEFLFLTEPTSNPDAECVSGHLGFRTDSQGSIHIYQELGRLGFTRLAPGPRGQDALIHSCEESIEQVLIATSSADSQPPNIQAFPLGSEWTMSFVQSELSWWGDVFAGWAAPADNVNALDLVLFDTETTTIRSLADKVGSWQSMWDSGYDYLLPTGWSTVVDPVEGSVELSSNNSVVVITIEPLADAGETDGPIDGEPLDFLSDEIALWAAPDQGSTATVFVGMQERLSWEWRVPSGTVVIYELQEAPAPVRITLTIDETASRHTTTLAFMVADLFRSHDAVG